MSVSSAGAVVRIGFGGPTPTPTTIPSPTPTPTADNQPPSAPSGLTAVVGKAKKVALTWGASNDNVGVTGYRVYRNDLQIGTAGGTFYTDTLTGKRASVTYYTRGYDAAGNLGPPSNPVTVTP